MTNERDILDECRRLGKEERHEDAINRLSQVIAVAPSHQLYHQRGMHYERLGKFDMALADFSSALLREPNEPSYLESRGVLLSSRHSSLGFRRRESIATNGHLPHQPRGVKDKVDRSVGVGGRAGDDVVLNYPRRHELAAGGAEQSSGVNDGQRSGTQRRCSRG